MFLHLSIVFCMLFTSLYAEIIETFYGPMSVEEPILLELIHSPPMQRLKHIHQYGVAYYTTHKEEYNRFDHSIGVFALLRKNGASMPEQISGLLHDFSHTVFSHVGDWVFGKEYREEDYQSTIFKLYLCHSGVEKILIKYGYTINQVFPKRKDFIMLEQPLPNLSADRIDYNIQGAYFQEFLTKQEAIELFEDLKFVDGHWITSRLDLLKKVVQYSYFMTQDCWGAPDNYATSRWLADAMIRGLDIGLLSWYEIHFGIDQDVWDKLCCTEDPAIKKCIYKLSHIDEYFSLADPKEADLFVKFRNRGINPWVFKDGELIRFSTIDEEIGNEYAELKEKAATGWPIKMN